MTHEPTVARQLVLDELQPHLAKVFEAMPNLRSIMLALAQYYADNAHDEVHTYLVGSEREIPVWPHYCARWDAPLALAGEVCERCARGLDWYSHHYHELITAFGSYCHEHADPEADFVSNYLPYAVFRRDGSVEVVGTVMRGFVELAFESEPAVAPIDPRAAELFEIACANPADDGLRDVLADHLTERGDPRGEYIALALATTLDADARARRDALLEQHRGAWMSPLERVVPAACARFERGLLAHVEAFVADADLAQQVRGAPVWQSVETLRFLPGSVSVLDPVMRALREVGPLDADRLVTLATAPQPWAIESLGVTLYDFHDREVRPWLAATNLPRLRELTVLATDYDWLANILREAVWFGQLERLTILDTYETALPWFTRATELEPLRWLCVAERRYDRITGWELAYCLPEKRFEVRLAGYWPYATRNALADLLARLPDGPVELVGTRLWQPTDDDVAALSRAGRTVTRR